MPTKLISYLRESLRELWERPEHQVPGLDGLRALAILLVVGGHFFGDFWTNHVRSTLPALAQLPLFRMGWTGVDLFFVLSGYLIGKQLWRERLTTGTVKFTPFILRRGFRIWPLFYFMLVYYTLFGPIHTTRWDFLFLTNFARFTGGFDDAWSLATEEQFYIIVPLVLIATKRASRVGLYFAGILAVLVGEWLLRTIVMVKLQSSGLSGRVLLDTMHYPIVLHCDALLAGLAIALLAVLRPSRFKIAQPSQFSRNGMVIFLASAVVAVALRQTNKIIFAFAGLALIYGGLTLLVLWDHSKFTAPFRWRIWYPISRLSYGMYLNNFAILPGITYFAFHQTLVRTQSVEFACVIGLIIGTLTSMGVAVLTFVLVERPFLLLRGRLLAH